MTGAFRIKLAAYIAIGTGAILALVETLLNWGNWQWWPWFVVDYVAAILLIVGGLECRKQAVHPQARALLAAGWAFTFGMSWMSLAGNYESYMQNIELERHARAGGMEAYVWLVGLGVVTSLIGLLLTIWPSRRGND